MLNYNSDPTLCLCREPQLIADPQLEEWQGVQEDPAFARLTQETICYLM